MQYFALTKVSISWPPKSFFFTWKNSSEGQMAQPWRTWTVKFHKVEMVPRVAKLHLAWYWKACVVSRPHPFLMASSRISGAQSNLQWWLVWLYDELPSAYNMLNRGDYLSILINAIYLINPMWLNCMFNLC